VGDEGQILLRSENPLKLDHLRRVEGDFCVCTQLSSLILASYDNILILGPDWMENIEEADAWTVLGLQILLEAHREA
jgi:hypothetical protein